MWILLALLCALLGGTSDAISKQLLVRSNERVVAWAKMAFTLPWMLLGPLLAGWPALTREFWILIVLMAPLELLSYICYLKAIRTTPISLVIPFLAFTPMLSALTAWIFLGERLSPLGTVGVLSVTVGAYVLQAELVPQGLLEPIRAMFRVPGIRLMLLTAAIYGLTSTLGKRAIQLSSPATFPFLYFSLDTFLLTGLIGRQPKGIPGAVTEVRGQWKLYLLDGVIFAAALFAHAYGIRLAPVAYFISIKRLSLVVSVLYGGLLYREEAFGARLAGTALMVAGVILIGLG